MEEGDDHMGAYYLVANSKQSLSCRRRSLFFYPCPTTPVKSNSDGVDAEALSKITFFGRIIKRLVVCCVLPFVK
jgi:hypothetical protein